MGIPLRETFSVSNGLPWEATVRRPELWLSQEWAVVKRGDQVDEAIARAARFGIRYQLEKVIIEKDEPVIEIYRRKEEVMVPHENVTTAFDLPGYRIKRNLGVVRGIVVRSRSHRRNHRRGSADHRRRQHLAVQQALRADPRRTPSIS